MLGNEPLIGLEWLESLVRYSILSAYVKDERPVNLLIVADVEEGKTQLLLKFAEIPSVLYMTDFTRYGLQRDWLPKFRDNTKRIIIIPDFNQLIGGKTAVATEGIISFLNGVTEEGIRRISTFGISIDLDKPLKLGIVGAISSKVFEDKRFRWRKSGFISRMVPVSYSVSKNTAAQIIYYLVKKEYRREKEAALEFPKEDTEITLDEKLAKRLIPLSQTIAKAVQTHGFRLQRQLQTLCMAKALSEKRTVVTEEDVEEIKKLASWVNLDYKPV